MRSYFAVSPSFCFAGGFADCMRWALRHTARAPMPIVIYKARGGERDAELIGEVTRGAYRRLPGGRLSYVRDLRRLIERGNG